MCYIISRTGTTERQFPIYIVRPFYSNFLNSTELLLGILKARDDPPWTQTTKEQNQIYTSWLENCAKNWFPLTGQIASKNFYGVL